MVKTCKIEAIIPTKEYDFGKYHKSERCWKMTEQELLEFFAKSTTPKNATVKNSEIK
ncbi:hypothetical protein KBB68_02330 [Candidatus Babeliales bacterium]|nr:hypothetical protein [Candidatus Babeliales bacterium]